MSWFAGSEYSGGEVVKRDVDEFFAHLEECEICGDRYDESLCSLGEDLLYEAAEDLGEEWQGICRRICERKQREKEAEANFQFYAWSEDT